MTIRDAFLEQSANCAALGSPFMGRLMRLAGERLQAGTPVTDRIFGWTGDATAKADNVPLRLAAGLHALKLGGLALEDVYPPRTSNDDQLWAAVEMAITDHATSILAWLETPPQTNEIRRAAIIMPALALLKELFGLPVELLELGTSGGLNLRADRFRLLLPDTSIGPENASVVLAPDWTGQMPPEDLPTVKRRAGVDLAPLDPTMPDHELKLLAYLWADQPERLTRTRAAIVEAKRFAAEIVAGDAGEWLERELASPRPDRLRVVLHTVAWQYFPQTTRARALAAMERAVGPLARLSMEYDGGRGAAVTLSTWPDGHSKMVARADFHGRWVDWIGF